MSDQSYTAWHSPQVSSHIAMHGHGSAFQCWKEAWVALTCDSGHMLYKLSAETLRLCCDRVHQLRHAQALGSTPISKLPCANWLLRAGADMFGVQMAVRQLQPQAQGYWSTTWMATLCISSRDMRCGAAAADRAFIANVTVADQKNAHAPAVCSIDCTRCRHDTVRMQATTKFAGCRVLRCLRSRWQPFCIWWGR